VVDCASTCFSSGQKYSFLFHLLVAALFPRVLVSADDDGGAVSPEEEGGFVELCCLKGELPV